MSNAWPWLTELGNSKWLLPGAALFIAVSIASGTLPWRDAVRWSLAITATALVVLASKIAFMGWGLGSAALDFTGFSGHAAMSACIYPPLAALVDGGQRLRRRLLVAAAVLLAATVGYSRLVLHAHSPSEVVSGFLLGSLAAANVLTRLPQEVPRLAPWKWLAPVATLVFCLHSALPRTNTHQAVIAVAKTLSGRDQLHTRRWLHENSASSRKWQEISTKNLAKTIDKHWSLGQHVTVSLSHTDFRSPP